MRPYLVLLAFLTACGDQDVQIDDTAGDDTATPGYTVDVVADGQTVSVDLSTLGTVDFEGAPVVVLPDVLDASGLSVPWSERTYDFVASDGFRPSEHSCPPLDWSVAAQGCFYPSTGNLVWDSSLGLSGCYYVDDVVTVEALALGR
ncbi:MAG: hypothetical protein JXB39_09195 [Deltaproteobacteria bacterium]|nr:hypothetical protein [Deltaproteobacteria bacterium]